MIFITSRVSSFSASLVLSQAVVILSKTVTRSPFFSLVYDSKSRWPSCSKGQIRIRAALLLVVAVSVRSCPVGAIFVGAIFIASNMSVGSVADDFIDAGVAAMIVAVSIAFAVSPVVVAGVVVTTVASIASVTVSSEISVAKTSETTIDGGMIGCSFQISGCLF